MKICYAFTFQKKTDLGANAWVRRVIPDTHTVKNYQTRFWRENLNVAKSMVHNHFVKHLLV